MALLDDAARSALSVHVPFISLMETEYILLRRVGPDRAQASISAVEAWPISIAESDPLWRHAAAAIKTQGGLSIADSWIAALAIMKQADLLHKDKEFDDLPGLRSVRL